MNKSDALARRKEAPSLGPPITTADLFGPKVKKAVLKKTATSLTTLAPLGVGLIGVAGCVILSATGFWVITGVTGIVVGAGCWAFNYFVRGSTIEAEHVSRMTQIMKQQNAERVALLRDQIERCRTIPDAEEYVDQGLRQYDNVDAQMQALQELLEMKLQQGELTHSRIVGTAQQLALSIMDNLRIMASTLAAIRAAKPDVINWGLEQLSRQEKLSASDEVQKRELETRKRLRDEALAEANRLADGNEEFITALIQATVDLGKMRPGGSTELESDVAMQQLRMVTARCATYGNQRVTIDVGGNQ